MSTKFFNQIRLLLLIQWIINILEFVEYFKLTFPADIGRKLASPARGSQQRLHAGESRQHLHAG